MNILAIESAAVAAGAAVLCGDTLKSEQFVNNGLTHSATLMELIDAALRAAGCTVQDMDVIAVSAGPGSFTGVRIGMGTAKGLALGAEKPLAAVSTLFGLAQNAAGHSGIVVPVMDARRGEVYTATYQAENGVLKELTPMRAIPLSILLKELETAMFVGDGAVVYKEDIVSAMGARAHFLPPQFMHQRAGGIAAAAKYVTPQSPHDAAPFYLRLPQAEREYAEKHKGDL